jgi:Flp pilus assembly protein TadG
MRASRRGERGQVAVYAVVLFPLLVLVLALVLAVGTVETLRSRLGAQLDMAALTATQAVDLAAMARGGRPALDPAAAEALARQYLAENVAALGGQLVASPDQVARAATVAVVNSPGTDPVTGLPDTAPTVSLRVRVPVRVPLLGLAGIGTTVTLDVTGSAAARS